MTEATTKTDPRNLLLLPPALKALADVAADPKTAGKYSATTCVRLERRPGGFRAEATDRRVLVREDGPHAADPAAYPELPALPPAKARVDAALVPAKVWAAAFKKAPKFTQKARKADADRCQRL